LTTFSSIANFPGTKQVEINQPERSILQLLYDSRLIANGMGGLFFAFSGSKGDGHRFIPQVAEKGVNQWVISDPVWADWLKKLGGQNWILVHNVLDTFQSISAFHRSEYSLPVVGITGSNGKTIVKEWLSQLIGSDFFICKSPKSFNSQIGVGLSVWNLGQGHNLGIFEAGVSHTGEMERLEKMIQPNLGILTSFGPAHEEGFASKEEKLKEKLSLFSKARYLIMAKSLFAQYHEIISKSISSAVIETWEWQKREKEKTYNLHFENQVYAFELPFLDDASRENLGNAIAMAIHLKIDFQAIQERLPLLSLPEMRLSLKEGMQGNVLIDDSYTNDLAGLEAALQFATLQRKTGQPLVLVLSDLQESLFSKEKLQTIIDSLAGSFQVNSIVTIGNQFEHIATSSTRKHINFESTEALLESGIYATFNDSIILVKGARSFRLELLVKAWQKKVHGTRLEINLDAMVDNLNFYKSQLPKGTGIMAMVKALGYGSGGVEVARILEFHNVEYLAVAYADEGIKLRQAGITLPIMVMNPMPEALQSIIDFKLEPEIYGFRILEAWIQTIHNQKDIPLPAIHLKIDTGMHRLGFFNAELEELVEILIQNKTIKVATVFSHLAGADDADLLDYSHLQIEKFEQASSFLKEKLNQDFKRHILNSAGILRFPDANYDLVRLGIGLYGIEVNSWFQNQLQAVSVLKTTISQIKSLKAGETVGYGRHGKLDKDSDIATIAIGYADGFRRDFSRAAAKVKIKNQWVPVIGNVCMDMTMVDVTGIQAEEGDEVVIFEDADSLLKLSKAAETIPYEILTGIGSRVKRIFYRA